MGAGMAYSALPSADSAVEDNPAWDCQRVILAVFLGGCTFSEIAALRFLGKERGRSSLGRAGARGCPAASHAPYRLRPAGTGLAVPALAPTGLSRRVQVHLPDHGHHQQRPHDGGHDRGQGLRAPRQ